MIVNRLSDNTVAVRSPAKINLFLKVLSKRPDGFHNISSLFQAVSLYDEIEFERTADSEITIDIVGNAQLTTGADNLITRVCQLVRDKVGFDGGLKIKLNKKIPVGAGLGGGSSNAAATIEALNVLMDMRLPRAKKAELGLKLGSDIPFFFGSGQAEVSGRGEIVRDVQLPVDYWIALISPSQSVSTAEAYAALKIDLTEPAKTVNFSHYRTIDTLFEFLEKFGNDFEGNHLETFPEHRGFCKRLEKHGARLARLSGTGSTFFGVFEKDPGEFLTGASYGAGVEINLVRPLCFDVGE